MSLVLSSPSIVRPAGIGELRDAVRCARAQGRRPCLDLGELSGVQVDPVRRVAWVQGGARAGTLDAAAQAHGLAVTAPRRPGASVADAVLRGGSGWLERWMGLTADHLRAARLMTADGDVVTVGAGEHPELLWALRGGGTPIGVPIELELGLRPLAPTVLGGALAWPLERAREVALTYRELMAAAPDALGGGLWLDRRVTVFVLYAGDPVRGAAHLAPLRALGPGTDTVCEVEYAALQARGGSARPSRRFGLRELSCGALDALLGAVAALGPGSSVLLTALGGAYGRVGAMDTAVGRRSTTWAVRAHGACAEWLEPVLAPHAEDPLARARDPERAARLAGVRAAWDPDGVFADSNPARALPPS
jgi:FAD/FMN-containing dehydrogenase